MRPVGSSARLPSSTSSPHGVLARRDHVRGHLAPNLARRLALPARSRNLHKSVASPAGFAWTGELSEPGRHRDERWVRLASAASWRPQRDSSQPEPHQILGCCLEDRLGWAWLPKSITHGVFVARREGQPRQVESVVCGPFPLPLAVRVARAEEIRRLAGQNRSCDVLVVLRQHLRREERRADRAILEPDRKLRQLTLPNNPDQELDR